MITTTSANRGDHLTDAMLNTPQPHPLRLPQIDLASALRQPIPHIDLRLEAYETSTRNFLKAVTNYRNRAITSITHRRNNQESEKKKVAERTAAIEAETNQCKLREIELVATLEQEKEERKDSELGVAAFRRQVISLKEKCAAIEAEIEKYRAVTGNLQREKNNEHSTLDRCASSLSPELEFCEQHLCCVIEGIGGGDHLLVRFRNVDPLDAGREFTFVVDVSSSKRVYKVVTSSPLLSTLPKLVDDLNETKDLYEFIRQVRVAYIKQVGTAPKS